jgi:glucokinase
LKVLSGDIGGTKTRLAVVSLDSGSPEIADDIVYQSSDYPSLSHVLAEFLSQSGAAIEIAGFGIAGPVNAGVCETTNLPWVIDAGQIRKEFGWQQVTLLNDLEAVGWGIRLMDESDLQVINRGIVRPGNRAVIAAGTGLGEAGLYWDGQQHRPFACEGGHTDFSPTTDTEMAFMKWIAAQYGHVSWERVVSGMGLENIYRFLLDFRHAFVPDWLANQMREGDAAAAVSSAGMSGKDAICVEALDLFIRFYAAEAGNHALKMMATGGVYIAGGITPRILERLQQGDFMEAFCDKGRMTSLMCDMPVSVVLNDKVALLGAALYAVKSC